MNRYNTNTAERLVARIAGAVGVPDEDADILANSLIDADLHGTSTHGVSRLDIYVRRIQKNLIEPKANLIIDQQRSAVLAVDAGNGLGQVQAVKVLDKLIPLAKKFGLAAATIHNSQHFGALSYYCNKAAKHDMCLFATTSSEPAMSPMGGCQAYFGTNPIGVSFPTGKGFPIKIDLATSRVARGNIIAAQKKGESIPEGWALDPEGRPTTDAGQALLGTVLTMAGHKGYALALMVEIFSSVLSGAAIGSDIGSMYKDLNRKQNVGHFFCLLDIEAFLEVSLFKLRVDSMIDAIKSCRKRPGVDEILLPGERSYQAAEVNSQKGLPIAETTVNELKALCTELQISFTLEEVNGF